MPIIHTLTLGLYQTNCYIVHNEGSKQCIVIDPGYAADTILNRAAVLGLEIQAILLTHGHFDHV
ncbi:MAG: MBL fold metallo-hydrolase, partial [Oscillospiraceae bacterium]|nr:MBL fold metallo-hydrolase [Oscillospiraceae bacterium]